MFQVASRQDTARRALARAAAVLAATFVLTVLIHPVHADTGPSILWPVNAILAGLLLRFRGLLHPASWLALYAGPLLGHLFLGNSWGPAGLRSLADLSGALTLWYIMTSRWAPGDLRSLRAIGRLLLANGAAAAIGTGATLIMLPWFSGPAELLPTAVNGFMGQFLSYCALLPAILLAPRYGSRRADPWLIRSLWRRYLQQPRTLLPLLALIISTGVGLLLGGPGAFALPIPALLYCALTYRQSTSAGLTAGAVMLLILGVIPGGLPPHAAAAAAAPPGDPWALMPLRLDVLLLACAPLLCSGIAAAHRDQVSRLTQALDHDSLTRALSRTAFLRRASASLSDIPGRTAEAGMLMLDVDHFKSVNDHHGHAAGDQALREFSSCIHAAIRPQDLFGRLGGEEFGVFLPQTSLQSSIEIAERLRACIVALTIHLPSGSDLSITVSVGVAHTSHTARIDSDTLLDHADQALYQAKRQGRNRITSHHDVSGAPPPAARRPDSCQLPPSNASTSIMPATSHPAMTELSALPPSIALLEDDPTQSAWLQEILHSAGFTCQAFEQGNDLLSALRAAPSFQLLLLDWELPGISGLEVLRWIRANLPDTLPVIFVTSRTLESDLVEGLDAGANDYLCKPCRPAELLARIRAQLRPYQSHATPDSSFRLGDFSIDTAARQIRLRGEPIQMTPKEFDLSALFLRHPWRLFSRDDLSALVWNRQVPSTSRTLDTHLSNIRKKLQLGPASGAQLNASYALGYRLEIQDASKATL